MDKENVLAGAAMTELLLTGTRFSVERRRVRLPDGTALTREVVVHPGAVVILPVLDAKRIVMIRNLRHSVGEELLELPAGTLEPGERVEHTAARELIEETGYRARSIEPLGCFYTSPGVMTELMHAYVAFDLECVGQSLEPGECISTEIVEVVRVRDMLANSELRDGKTIAALGLYIAKIGRRAGAQANAHPERGDR